MSTTKTKLLNVEQVRVRLDCSRSYVYQLIEQGAEGGGLDGVRIGRVKGVRVRASEVERFLTERAAAGGE